LLSTATCPSVKAASPKTFNKASFTEKLQIAKPIVAGVVANALIVLPSHAEAGKIFDFNLTLPIIAAEFLALMAWGGELTLVHFFILKT